MDSHELAQFVTGKNSNLQRVEILTKYFMNDNAKGEHVVREVIEKFEIPSVYDICKFNYSFDDLLRIAKTYSDDENMVKRILRYASVYCGIRIGDDESLRLVRLDKGYKPLTRYPRTTINLFSRRLSIRVVPQHWKSYRGLYTDFVLYTRNGGHYVYIGEREVGRIPSYYQGSNSIYTLSYLSNRGDKNKYTMTVNPIQDCPHLCKMCCRAYYDIEERTKCELTNLMPDELARYVFAIYGKVGFKKINEIAFITGGFKCEDDLVNYIQEFISVLGDITNNAFDPRLHWDQHIKVSSHLLKTKKNFRALKSMGMKIFTYTVESITDCNRKIILNDIPNSKGYLGIDQVSEILENASSIWGKSNIESVIIIGVDKYDDTLEWLDKMYKTGYRTLTRGLFNVYNQNHFQYYQMNLEKIMSVASYINRRFISGYRQQLDTNNDHLFMNGMQMRI